MAYFLKYNDIIVSEFAGFGVVAAEMPSVPEHELTTKTINSRNGDIYFSGRDKSREITLTFNVRTTIAEDYEQTTYDLKNCFKTKDESPLYIGTEDKYINAIVETYNFTDVFIAESSFYGEGEIKFLCVDPYFYKGDAKVYDELSEDELVNDGDVATYPKISVEFPEQSTFLQIDSDNGSILLGNYPKVGKTDAEPKELVLSDECNSLSAWTSVGNVVDEGSTGDTLIVGSGGSIFEPNITSTSDGWHGAAYRINLPENVKNFTVSGHFYFGANLPINFDSGSGGSGSTSGQFKVTASVSLNIRSGRGTSYKKIGSIPSGKIVTVTDIQTGWGKVTYNGKTGYCSMKYLRRPELIDGGSDANYKTTASLNLRSGRGTKYKIKLTIPKNTKLKVTDISNEWGKTTYKSTTGYVKTSYLSKLTSSSAISIVGKDTGNNAQENTATSSRLGLLEMYGFDSQNNKLFKCQMLDSNYYYKHSIPSLFIGSNQVARDAGTFKAPNTKKDKDGNTYKIDSGDNGNGWSNTNGFMYASRENNVWTLGIEKIGNIEKNNEQTFYRIDKSLYKKGISSDKYPTGDLAYIVIYMAGYSDYDLQKMYLDSIKVYDMTPERPEEYNEVIFNQGDIVDIDCYNNTVTKNGENYMQHLDIGSTFFPLSPGKNNVSVATSCTSQVSAAISFTEKFN